MQWEAKAGTIRSLYLPGGKWTAKGQEQEQRTSQEMATIPSGIMEVSWSKIVTVKVKRIDNLR